jgi:hypothetical protein
VNLPFPFGKRRMTVAGASDFQSRPVILSKVRPSLLWLKYRFGDHTWNLEHRRVKVSPRELSGAKKPSVES